MEVIYHTEFGQFHALSNDFIGYKMKDGQHFEEKCVKKLLEYIKPGDIVLDVGAHIGTYTIPFAKAVGPSGKVYSFEPQARMRELLHKNIKANGMEDRVVVNPYAVGHVNKLITMSANTDDSRKVDYNRKEIGNFGGMNVGKGGEQVKMVSLDNIFFPSVNVIKIDVEGCEPLVIDGAREIIETYKPVVFYEKNHKTITREMIEMFNLSKNLINFDAKDYFIKEKGYHHLENIGFNYIAIPMSKIQSNYEKVKEFTEAAGSKTPAVPELMTKEEVIFLVKMVMSEMQEIVDTVTDSADQSLELMRNCLGVDQSKHDNKNKSKLELIAEQADGAVDSWIYLLNSFCRKGVDLSKVFDIVHEANMAKRDPATGKFILRESDGKIMKPPGWTAPDITAEIKRQSTM